MTADQTRNALAFLTPICISLIVLYISSCSSNKESDVSRPRIIITADPELDDLNSLIRFLLYSNEMKVEGLIYASSQFHWKGDGKGTKWFVPGREYTRYGLQICPCESWRWKDDERFIHEAVEAYEKVYSNLKIHSREYPDPEDLKSKIYYGNIEFDGDFSKDTPGSDHIKSLMMDDKPGPLFITAWGGHSTIARALKSIEDEYSSMTEWTKLKKKISEKVILLPSGDQDDTYSKYIKPNWPEIESRQFRGGPRYGYAAQMGASPEDSILLTATWMKENISSKGPLGEMYRVWGDGKQMVKDDIFDYFGIAGKSNEELKKMGYIVWLPVMEKGSWLGEGDTGTFMNMLGNGLRAFEHGSFGGWGGIRVDTEVFSFQPASPDAMDSTLEGMMSTLNSFGSSDRNNGPVFPDFFQAAQKDFAARMTWSVTPKFEGANHEPLVKLKEENMKSAAGRVIQLEASVTDPDGDNVTYYWKQFPTGSYHGRVAIEKESELKTTVRIPDDARPGQTIHFVLEATDGTLTRYGRVVVVVK